MQTVISWNVNGVRAVQKKGFCEWLEGCGADVVCIQETKAMPEQLNEALLAPPSYHANYLSAERKGYSGVAVFSREEPLSIEPLGTPEFDCEGRTVIVEFPHYTVLNCYFPNSQAEGARIDYKIAFCDAVLEKCDELCADGRDIVLCGDYNIAHKAIDLKNPKNNEKNPGYLPEERAWMDTFIGAGYVDTFRMFCDDPGHYSWWSYRFKARERDIGWRIDYHCVNERFRPAVKSAAILKEIMGSDHCPVTVTLDVPGRE
ncbi:MAG: exodeoxyribonuclease III [Lentisphaeria bacterium]|nr:exodeoxyribonuclease III [Lentisphaeria bacterium]